MTIIIYYNTMIIWTIYHLLILQEDTIYIPLSYTTINTIIYQPCTITTFICHYIAIIPMTITY